MHTPFITPPCLRAITQLTTLAMSSVIPLMELAGGNTKYCKGLQRTKKDYTGPQRTSRKTASRRTVVEPQRSSRKTAQDRKGVNWVAYILHVWPLWCLLSYFGVCSLLCWIYFSSQSQEYNITHCNKLEEKRNILCILFLQTHTCCLSPPCICCPCTYRVSYTIGHGVQTLQPRTLRT